MDSVGLGVAKPACIELGSGRGIERIAILHEDRSVLAVDKPRGWMLVPFTWQKTNRNLQAAIQSSIGAGAFWARSRNLRYLRYVHRLDADTTGILLFAKSPGGVRSLAELFESRRMHKRYLAVVRGTPTEREWICRLRLDRDPDTLGRMRVVSGGGKEAVTEFRVLETRADRTLIEARPQTGRTHQIRVHLAAARVPVLGDVLYGDGAGGALALRAVELRFVDPFTRRWVHIHAPEEAFLAEFGMGPVPEVEAGQVKASADQGPEGRRPVRSSSSNRRLRQSPPP